MEVEYSSGRGDDTDLNLSEPQRRPPQPVSSYIKTLGGAVVSSLRSQAR